MEINLVEFAKDYGPAFLSIIGTLLGLLVSGVSVVVRYAWKQHTARMTTLLEATKELAERINVHEENTKSRTQTTEKIVQGLRAEIHMVQQKFEHIRVSLMGCEANVKSQQNTITEHIRELAKIDSKLEAVFRFVDAPRRSSDVR
jgi:chromosome segregation ATPase